MELFPKASFEKLVSIEYYFRKKKNYVIKYFRNAEFNQIKPALYCKAFVGLKCGCINPEQMFVK